MSDRDQPKKTTVQMRVIPKPTDGTRAVFHPSNGAVIRGAGDIAFVCGGCRNPLMVDMTWDQTKNLVIRCEKCGANNEVLDISMN